MNYKPHIGHSEGQLTTQPPLLNGSLLIWWKARMEMYIQGETMNYGTKPLMDKQFP